MFTINTARAQGPDMAHPPLDCPWLCCNIWNLGSTYSNLDDPIPSYPHASGLPVPQLDQQTIEVVKLVHPNVLSPNALSCGHRRYVITLVKDRCCMLWVEPLTHKGNVFRVFLPSSAPTADESGRQIQCLCSHNRGKFTYHKSRNFLQRLDTSRDTTTAPPAGAANGVGEPIN